MNNDIAKSVAANTTVMMASQFITGASSFVLMLFLPRHLGSEGYGMLYLAISITMIFQIVIDFGGPFFIAKEVARDRSSAGQILSNSIAIRFIFWLVSVSGMLAFAFIAGYPFEVIAMIFILGVSKLWECSDRVLHSCFQGFEAMSYTSVGAITERAFLMVAGITALLLGANGVVIACVMAVSTLLSFLVGARFMRRFISTLPRWDAGVIRRFITLGLPYFLYSIFGVIYYRVDAVMLSFWATSSVVGWYGAAYRFFDVLMFIPNIFTVALFPILARIAGQQAMLATTTRKSMEFVLITGIPLSIIIFAFASPVIDLLFDLDKYGPSVVLLRIFAAGMLLVYIDIVLGTALFASDRQKQWSVVAFLAMLVNVGLNFFLIPYFQTTTGNGGIGAAIATLVTEFAVMCGALALLPKSVFMNAPISVQMKALISGVFMGATVWILDSQQLPWFVTSLVASAVYVSLLLSLRAFEPAELAFMRSFASIRNLKSTFALQKQSR